MSSYIKFLFFSYGIGSEGIRLAKKSEEKNHYGPSNCIEIGSEHGTKSNVCVIRTHCTGQDLSNVEYGFVCQNGKDFVFHSFGVNSFDEEEEFVSDVACMDGCYVPENHSKQAQQTQSLVVKPVTKTVTQRKVYKKDGDSTEASAEKKQSTESTGKTAVTQSTTAEHSNDSSEAADSSNDFGGDVIDEEKNEEKAEVKYLIPRDDEQFEVKMNNSTEAREKELRNLVTTLAKYQYEVGGDPGKNFSPSGPNDCASVYKSKYGTCVMQTECEGSDLSNFNFGFTCVDGSGKSARHLFGEGSFLSTETFDSGVPCALCMGLDVQMLQSRGALQPPKQAVSEGEMQELKSELQTLEKKVEKLTKKVDNLYSQQAGALLIQKDKQGMLQETTAKKSSSKATASKVKASKAKGSKTAKKKTYEPTLNELVQEQSGDYTPFLTPLGSNNHDEDAMEKNHRSLLQQINQDSEY